MSNYQETPLGTLLETLSVLADAYEKIRYNNLPFAVAHVVAAIADIQDCFNGQISDMIERSRSDETIRDAYSEEELVGMFGKRPTK